MALIKCSECGKEISNSAKSCPHCGFVYKKDNSTLKTIIICIGTLFSIVLVILFISILPDIIDSILERKALNTIIGEYTIVNSSNDHLNETISITKENTKIPCSEDYFPPAIGNGYYNIYIEDNKQYVITTLNTLGIKDDTLNIESNDSKYVFMLYENGKLISQPKKNLTIKCGIGTSVGNPTSNIEIEYKKN